MNKWFCLINEQQYGPVSLDKLRGWITEQRLGSNNLVWKEGMAEWLPASNVPELAASLGLQGVAVSPAITPENCNYSLTPHRGTAVLVLGILGLVVCFICGIIAWVMGKSDLEAMDAGTMDPSGRGTTQAGKICGMISVILWCVFIGFYLLIIIFAMIMAISTS